VPVIELNGAIVAVAMVLCGVGTASLVRHGYVHGDLERLGLGNLIIAHCVRTAAARGLGDFDHSIGNAGWKAGYRPRQDPLFDLSALLTLPGTVFGAVLRLKRRFGASSLSPIEAWPF